MKIRQLQDSDTGQISELFLWHCENGLATFQNTWTSEDTKNWLKRFDSPKHIALVAEVDGRIVGVCCSFAYRGGGVFKETAESSIYLHPDSIGQGLGSKLYEQLFSRLEGKGLHRIVVGIAIPNEGSVALHKKLGFEEIGVFDEYAFFKGQYRSSLWMQKKMNSRIL